MTTAFKPCLPALYTNPTRKAPHTSPPTSSAYWPCPLTPPTSSAHQPRPQSPTRQPVPQHRLQSPAHKPCPSALPKSPVHKPCLPAPPTLAPPTNAALALISDLLCSLPVKTTSQCLLESCSSFFVVVVFLITKISFYVYGCLLAWCLQRSEESSRA